MDFSRMILIRRLLLFSLQMSAVVTTYRRRASVESLSLCAATGRVCLYGLPEDLLGGCDDRTGSRFDYSGMTRASARRPNITIHVHVQY